jgi:hypothetical protein
VVFIFTEGAKVNAIMVCTSAGRAAAAGAGAVGAAGATAGAAATRL